MCAFFVRKHNISTQRAQAILAVRPLSNMHPVLDSEYDILLNLIFTLKEAVFFVSFFKSLHRSIESSQRMCL